MLLTIYITIIVKTRQYHVPGQQMIEWNNNEKGEIVSQEKEGKKSAIKYVKSRNLHCFEFSSKHSDCLLKYAFVIKLYRHINGTIVKVFYTVLYFGFC